MPHRPGTSASFVVLRHNHHVAGTGADDLDQAARPDPRADRPEMRVERPYGHGGAFCQARLAAHSARQPADRLCRSSGPCPSAGYAGPPSADRVCPGTSHRDSRPTTSLYIALCPAAQTPIVRSSGDSVPVSIAGIQSAISTHRCAASKTFGRVRRQCRILLKNHSLLYVPPHLARYCGPHLAGQRRDLGGLGDGGMILPEPRHRGRIIGEPFVEGERVYLLDRQAWAYCRWCRRRCRSHPNGLNPRTCLRGIGQGRLIVTSAPLT